MRQGLLLLLLTAAAAAGPAWADEPKPADSARTLEDLLKAYNAIAAKDAHQLFADSFKEAHPEARFERDLRAYRAKFGKVLGEPAPPRVDGDWRVYRVQGEKQPFLLRLGFGADGRLTGLEALPTFREGLPPGPVTPADLHQRLQAAVEQTLYAYRVPSISVALVKDDRIVWAKAFGYQNAAKAVPADTETTYVTGSIFKVVVATALVQLADEGKLELDAPVNRYLKAFQVPNFFEKDAPLTARHLLSHHGGVPNRAATVPLWKRDLPTPVEDLLRRHAEVTFKPGDRFQYSNLGYTLIGYLVGQLAGTTFEDAMKARLFGPLEMAHTEFEPTPAMTENLALPYQDSTDGKQVQAVPRVRFDVYPAGDVYSTPSDMARFLLLHLNAGKYKERQLVSAKGIEEMGKVQFPKKDEKSGFGLGWGVDGEKGRRRLHHNGAVPGFFTHMSVEPERRTGVVLFCNKFSTLPAALGGFVDPLDDVAELAYQLLDRLEPANAAVKQ